MSKIINSESASYFYSASTGGFYPVSLKVDYETAGSWPVDAVSVADEDMVALQAGQSAGKQITANAEGYPVLTDPKPLTPEQLQQQAKVQQSALMNAATDAIAPLQDAVDLDEATEEELLLLKEWKKYRVMLNRLDLSSAPEINWPDMPLV
ncbi:TPA: tail fiber assembly protein [Citrobacter koseri]|uniref:tail fiber assembly protein n=1 Tax=Citrobacter koseri TaxID=545 RepID=UPI0007350EC3|nr:tail fiber assembly protein [Citrobacter koseri]PNN12501.1 tail fiber assembly protein [Citrobacter koseri]HAZ8818493.1 tail fiber assembly protein [Citrobacter koseri]